MDTVNTALALAKGIAVDKKHKYLTAEHLALAMLQTSEVIDIILSHGEFVGTVSENVDEICSRIHANLDTLEKEPENGPTFTQGLTRVLERALVHATFSGRTQPNAVDILLGIVSEEHSFSCRLLEQIGITNTALSEISEPADVEEGSNSMDETAGQGRPNQKNDASSNKKVLDEYTTNLNLAAATGDLDPLVGREEVVESVIQTLARKKKSNLVLTGEPGVGKTAIAEGLAQRIVDGMVPDVVKDYVIYSLDISALLAGTRYRGDFEQRIKQLVDALMTSKRAILFIDEIHMIMGAGSSSENKVDVANVLKPALQSGKLKCIGSTTDAEYRAHFEKDRALARRFLRVDVPEPTVEQAIEMVEQTLPGYESFFETEFTQEAVVAACELSAKYMHDKKLPDKAFDLIDSTAAREIIKPEENRASVVTADMIRHELARITRIPIETIVSASQVQNQAAINIETEIARTVYGQDKAISVLADSIYVSQAGLKATNKPVGSYLFTGPTGVGKTETARALANILNKTLVKFDMSEYQEKHSVAKLIGAPPGYVGYSDGANGNGALINALEKNPSCVLLLDEVEKAHPDALQVLLQILDDGLITSSDGKQVSARNSVIIMTSNLGARDSESAVIGFTGGQHTEAQEAAVKQFFAPEFRNRLDGIVQFNKISKTVAISIVEKFLKEVQEMCSTKDIKLKWNKGALEMLAEQGFDDKLGARPLARLIHEKIKKPLAKRILFGEDNITQVTITIKNNELSLNIKTVAPTTEAAEA